MFELDRIDSNVSKFSFVVILVGLLISSSWLMGSNWEYMLFDMLLIGVIGYIITLIMDNGHY